MVSRQGKWALSRPKLSILMSLFLVVSRGYHTPMCRTGGHDVSPLPATPGRPNLQSPPGDTAQLNFAADSDASAGTSQQMLVTIYATRGTSVAGEVCLNLKQVSDT